MILPRNAERSIRSARSSPTTPTARFEAHDVRTRNAGRMTFVEFHLVVPGEVPVKESHAICDRIEKALRTEVRHAHITIHVEPEDKAKHTGVVVV